MTMEERIERAAIDEWSHFESLKRLSGGNPIAWDAAHEEERQKFRNRLGWHLRAAFPELFTDPPTAWIAPLESTKEMHDACFAGVDKYGTGAFGPDDYWDAM